MLFALDISVNKKDPPTHSVNWGLKPLQKHFAKPSLKSKNYPSLPF